MCTCVDAEKLYFEHLLYFDIARCSHINTVYLKDLTFLFISQHQLWNDTYLRIAMVTDRGLLRLLHVDLHWLDVPERVQYKLGVTMRRCQQHKAPQVPD